MARQDDDAVVGSPRDHAYGRDGCMRSAWRSYRAARVPAATKRTKDFRSHHSHRCVSVAAAGRPADIQDFAAAQYLAGCESLRNGTIHRFATLRRLDNQLVADDDVCGFPDLDVNAVVVRFADENGPGNARGLTRFQYGIPDGYRCKSDRGPYLCDRFCPRRCRRDDERYGAWNTARHVLRPDA